MNASQDDANRIEIGSHVITAERNGVLHMVVRGVIFERDALVFKNAMSDYGKRYPAYHLIVVVTEMEGIESAARRAVVTQDRRYAFGYCYIVGASFAIRTLIAGIHRARRLLQPGAIVATTLAVDSEEEARTLIAAHQQGKSTR